MPVTLIDVRNYYRKTLKDYYSKNEIDFYFKILIISSGDCLSFSVKKTSKPIALGSAKLTFSIIFAKTDLFHGNCPNLLKLFSSISIMITLLLSFFKGKTFW